VAVFARIAKAVKDHPWWVIAICLLVTLVLGAGLLFLSGHVTYQSLLPESFPSVKALDSLRKNFGGISYEYVLVRAPDVTDSRVVQSIIGLEGALRKDPRFNAGQLATQAGPEGDQVPVLQNYLSPFVAVMQREISSRGIKISLGTVTSQMVQQFTGKDYQRLVNEDYLSNPQASQQVVGRFITPDHKAALIMLKEGPNITEKQEVRLGSDLQDFFHSNLGRVPGVKVSISGDATLARDFNAHIRNKTLLLFVIALILVVLTLFVAFKRLSDTFLPIAVMLLGVVWTFGFTGWVGIEYSVAVIAVMPLLLGLALTFVVPFMARYYEDAEEARPRRGAVGTALIAVGVAIFLAAITNFFGFLVFGFSILPALRDFGMVCAVGNMFVFILAVTMLPAVMDVRERASEKRARAADEKKARYFDGLSLRKSRGVFTRATNRVLSAFTNLSVAHAVPMIIIFAVLIFAGFAQVRSLNTDSDLRKLVPASLPGMSADFELEKYFGGHQQDVVEVTGDVLSPGALKAMSDLENSVVNTPATGGKTDLYTQEGAMGLQDALAAANGGKLPATREEAVAAVKTAQENGGYVVGGLLSADNSAALVTFNASGALSTAVVDKKMDVLKENCEKYLVPVGLQYQLGGITPLTKDMTRNIIPTETWSSMLSLVLCALVLVIIFRSLPYGLITLTVALAGIAAEIGFLRIMNWPLDIMTSLVSALVIGVGVNFGILFTYRYIQEMRDGKQGPGDAISSTMNNLGRANVIAAVTTVAAFVIVMFSGIVPLRRFGGVTAVAITICMVTSLTLMPALLYLMSKRAERRAAAVPESEPEPQVT
jgi:hydrophobe/amphiphile efflux-3 (HAE3) family protein